MCVCVCMFGDIVGVKKKEKEMGGERGGVCNKLKKNEEQALRGARCRAQRQVALSEERYVKERRV